MAKPLPGWLGPVLGALIAIAIGVGIILYVHSQNGENRDEPGEKPTPSQKT